MDFVFSGLKLILCHIQVSMLKSKSVLLNQFGWSLLSVRSSVILLLPLLFVGGRMSYLRYLWLFAHSGVQRILRCVFPRFVYHMVSVSLDSPYLIASSVFSNIYLSCVLCTICCQFLWIHHTWLPLRFSLTFSYYLFHNVTRLSL
jgi:hypothetical protein